MMRMSKTRIGADTYFLPVAPGYTISQEGLALVAFYQGGLTYAIPSQGVANERFLGFSGLSPSTPDRMTTVEVLTVPTAAPYQINTGLLLIASQMQATILPAGLNTQLGSSADPALGTAVGINISADVTAGAPAAGNILVAGTQITFNAAQSGAIILIQAAYTPTMAQAALYQGQSPAGGVPGVAASEVGIIRSGNIYTDRYDLMSSFDPVSGNTPVKLYTGPNGLISTSNTGTDLSAAIELLEAPTIGFGFLGVRAK
jgi:hypothetical protein